MNLFLKLARALLVCATSCVLLSGCYMTPPDSTDEIATQGLYAAALSEQGDALVVGSILHGGSLWRLGQTAERQFDWNHRSGQFSQLTVVAISRDGLLALTAVERQIVAWNTQTGESIGFWLMPDRVNSAALSDGGTYALVGLDNQLALYIDLDQGVFASELGVGADINSVAISSDGGLGIIGDDDGAVSAWVLQSGQQIRRWSLEDPINIVSLSADGHFVFAASKYRGGALWNAAENVQLNQFSFKRGIVTAVRFVDDEHLLLALSSRQIQLQNWRTSQTLETWNIPRKNLWRPDGVFVYDLSLSEVLLSAVGSNGVLYRWQMPGVTQEEVELP